MNDAIRTCTKCLETKPISEYHRDAKSPGGFRRQCKPCRCSQTMDWWYENQERQLARHQEYSEANRERLRETDSRRYWRDRDVRLDLAVAVSHSRRARAVGAPFDTKVTRTALRERDGDLCHYCQQAMDFDRADRRIRPSKATIDHVLAISSGGGHTFNNTVLACWSCNSDKGNLDVESFRERLERGSTPGAA